MKALLKIIINGLIIYDYSYKYIPKCVSIYIPICVLCYNIKLLLTKGFELQEEIEQSFELKPADYKKSINNNQRFYLQFNFFTPEVEAIFMKIIHRFLGKHDVLYLKDMLITVIRELITNASKANIKRLYFKLMELDINKKEDYRKGMETFQKRCFYR